MRKNRRKNISILSLIIATGFLFVGCSHYRYFKSGKCDKRLKKEATAVIAPVNKSRVRGWARFQKIDKKQVLVTAEIKGLKPNKKYGFHIHQYGDCRDNGKNAGAHLNPGGQHKHGSPDSQDRHLGDLGNLKSNKAGKAVYAKTVDMCMYKAGGRAVIIHAGEDDLKSQPSGNAGPYIGCGVIGYTKSTEIDADSLSIADKKPGFVPVKKNGKVVGLRLQYIEKDSIYEQMGFKSADVIVSVAGKKVKSTEHFKKLIAQIKKQSEWTMTLKRDGKEIVFSWSEKEGISIKAKSEEAKPKKQTQAPDTQKIKKAVQTKPATKVKKVSTSTERPGDTKEPATKVKKAPTTQAQGDTKQPATKVKKATTQAQGDTKQPAEEVKKATTQQAQGDTKQPTPKESTKQAN